MATYVKETVTPAKSISHDEHTQTKVTRYVLYLLGWQGAASHVLGDKALLSI